MSDNAIANIRQVVDEHQSSVILSSSCLKTQKCLLRKLKEQLENQKVERNFINKSNMRLEMEIRLDEQKLNSLHIAVNTIQSANVEAKKEYLLIKELRSEDTERIKNGINKYEKEWALAKEKYENIPYIKEYLDIKSKIQASQDKVKALLSQTNELYIQINRKRYEVFALDKERVLKLVQFLTKGRPMYLKMLNEYEVEKRNLSQAIEQIKDTKNVPTSALDKMKVQNVPMLEPAETASQGNEDLLLPSIKLQSVDLDVLSDRLNQIKKIEISKHNEIANMPVIDPLKKINTPHLKHDYLSGYFDLCNIVKPDTNDYSNKKLINILDDIKLNENETSEIIARVIPSKLQDVNVIGSKDSKNAVDTKEAIERLSQKTPIETGEIEEIDLTTSNSQGQMVLPPTQFMDLTQDKKFTSEGIKDGTTRLSQEKVSFEPKQNEPEIMEVENSSLNTSALSNNSYTNVKDMILKKYNLDLSPQFVYSKNTMQTKTKDTIVTSKFFVQHQGEEPKEHENSDIQSKTTDKENISEPIQHQPIASTSQGGETVKPIEGLLFAHGPHGLMESLELSCTDNAEGDSEYLHGIDSSLLMSPKADDVPNDGEEKDKSEGISNFLAGIKKSGFSFFGTGVPNQETNPANQENNNFTFSFGGESKKKGGLFSMFH